MRKPRKFMQTRLLIATKNQGKFLEFQELLSKYNVQLVSACDLMDAPAPEETGNSFKDNAILKAKYYANIANLPALADDSGLEVDELEGKPGIHSARLAEEEGGFDKAMDYLYHQLKAKGKENSTGRFVCALALYWPDGHSEQFEGKIEGQCCFPPKGEKGFGYDPIFYPKGMSRSFAELDKDEKNTISHRAKAFKELKNACFY